MQSKRMSSLLVDVDAAMTEADEPSVLFTTVSPGDHDANNQKDSSGSQGARSENVDVHAEETDLGAANDVDVNKAAAKESVGNDVAPTVDDLFAPQHSRAGGVADEQQAAVITDSLQTVGFSGEQEDVSSPISHNVEVLPVQSPKRFVPEGFWDDCPSFELFSQDDPLYVDSEDAPKRANDAVGTPLVDTTCAADGQAGSMTSSILLLTFFGMWI